MRETPNPDKMNVGQVEFSRDGKRESRGYQLMALRRSEELVAMSQQLATAEWPWQPYHQFVVCDPKRRTIYAAPFRDRVVHHAIHQVIAPIIDALIPRNSWACRQGMGSRGAAAALAIRLNELGKNRYVVKLDVRSYFTSIDHSILYGMINAALTDSSLNSLLASLLGSHPEYRRVGKGIPLGNLTSQLFANYYLHAVDRLGLEHSAEVFYVRYMDDIVLAGRSKKAVLDLKDDIVTFAKDRLMLTIPIQKTVHLASDPVPFLGYLIDVDNYAVLGRTLKRHHTRLKRMQRTAARSSDIAKSEFSFAAFASLDEALHKARAAHIVRGGDRS